MSIEPRDLTHDEAHRLFRYEGGVLYWRVRPSQRTKVGDRAGHVRSDGYVSVNVKGKQHKVHRIVFVMHHGHAPRTIDHIDRNPSNNRIENLRDVTHAVNCQRRGARSDNTSGVTGVQLDRETGKWRAGIWVDGHAIRLGRFSEFWDAVVARRDAEHRYFGELTPSIRQALETVL